MRDVPLQYIQSVLTALFLGAVSYKYMLLCFLSVFNKNKKAPLKERIKYFIQYERQAVRWPEALRNRYFSIAERCDKETMLQTHYTQDCLWKRNQYMVDHADIVLAVCNMRLHSGSKQTVLMARRRLKPVWLVFPDTLELYVI